MWQLYLNQRERAALRRIRMERKTLTDPATEIEKAAVLDQVRIHFGPADAMILRRVYYELDRLKLKASLDPASIDAITKRMMDR